MGTTKSQPDTTYYQENSPNDNKMKLFDSNYCDFNYKAAIDWKYACVKVDLTFPSQT